MPSDRHIAALFRMDEAAWARHANPWSGWTRVASLPLLALAVWSRAWIGWWALAAVAAVLVWIWVNPRLFPPPASTRGWMSRVTFGERIWLLRDRVALPPHHRRAPHLLTTASLLGLLPLAWGLWTLSVWPTLFGILLSAGAKLWFADRMAWLYEEMKDRDPAWRGWLR